MAGNKIIAVVGGTGNLGSSVARSLHENLAFKVRVTSRDPTAPKAKQLADEGIEVVKADSWKPEELEKAFEGCYGLFFNIDSDTPNFKQQIGPTEYDMGRIIVDAAAKANIKHVVCPSLPAATKLTGGKVPITSFDDKSATADYALQNDKFATATVVSAGWFFENSFDPKYVASFGGFAGLKDEDGYLTWKTPCMSNDPEGTPFLAVADDYGDFVHGVFLEPEKWNKRYIHGVSDILSFTEMTAAFQEVTGKPARYVEVKGSGALTAKDANKTKEINGLFDVMHALDGNFFNGEPTDPEPARQLKRNASQARGRGGDAKPMTGREFFVQYAQ